MSAVSEIMSKGLQTADLASRPSVADITDIMLKNKIGSVILLRSGKPAGIVTERDILRKVVLQKRNAGEIPASDIMSSPLITVQSYDSVDTAAELMSKNKVKRLPVLESDGSVVGMLSVTDIAKKLAKILADDYNRYGVLKATMDL